MIAALYVQTNGVYYGLPDVDPWDEARDARKYAGPWPVVAHPPCASWGALAGFREYRWGLKRGDDGFCFAAALNAVQTYGGVLEHPANSAAWVVHGLRRPAGAGWHADCNGGWTCAVDQGNYGHRMRKPTWLYAVGVELPSIDWRRAENPQITGNTGSKGGKGGTLSSNSIAWMPKSERAATPIPFRDLLLSIARSHVRSLYHFDPKSNPQGIPA